MPERNGSGSAASRASAQGCILSAVAFGPPIADGFYYDFDPPRPLTEEDFPAIEKIARAAGIGPNIMIANGERALRAPAAAADPEFLELFELPFVAGDSHQALRSPRSVVLKKDFATKLFGVAPALGQHVRVGNVADATVTGVIDAIPEPSHMGRSKIATLQFDFLTSWDVSEALDESRRPANAPARLPFARSSRGSMISMP